VRKSESVSGFVPLLDKSSLNICLMTFLVAFLKRVYVLTFLFFFFFFFFFFFDNERVPTRTPWQRGVVL